MTSSQRRNLLMRHRIAALIAAVCLMLLGVAGSLPSASASGSQVTVQGPKMWDPVGQAQFATASSVTVDQTADLVSQMVHVSWRGFTPSTNPIGSPAYDQTNTDYPVMVAQCAGAAPTDETKCFGANNGGSPGAFTADGPTNTGYAITNADGTGQLDFRILTALDNQTLGCDTAHPCSLVIFPSQGGNYTTSPTTCSDHSLDTFASGGVADTGVEAFNFGTAGTTGVCSWASRIVVPLRFAATAANCPFRHADFTMGGSPMAGRAIDQWRPGICTGAHPLQIQYDSALNEPLAGTDFLLGTQDVALTTRPVAGTAKHPFTYAPVAISGVAIAYWIDDPVTGQPVRNLKLNPRLVAKLLTTSYNFLGSGCVAGQPPPANGCDPGVSGNPSTLFADKEFQQLNPGVAVPSGAGSGMQVPTVASGNSDLTYEVTRWMAADSNTAAFISGTADQWGMHVNTSYKGAQYPTDSFTAQDPFPIYAHRYNPVFPMNLVAQYQAANWEPGTAYLPDQTGNFTKDPAEVPGTRALFAVVPLADAAAFHLPVASILNHAGKYVSPTAASLTAAWHGMKTNADGVTRAVNESSTDPAAYPLTMVHYAMVPTGGVGAPLAAKIAQFLTFVAGAGQTQGPAPGQLPPGFLPLPADQRAQTLCAAQAVLHQNGATPGCTKAQPHTTTSAQPTTSHSPTTSPTTSPSSSTSPGSSNNGISNNKVTGGPSPGVSLPLVGPLAGTKSPDSAGFTRILLPILLSLGGLLLVGGPGMYLLGRTSAGTALIARVRGSRLIRRFSS